MYYLGIDLGGTNIAEDCPGDRIRGVFLIAAELDDDAFVHPDAVDRIGGFGMVGMCGMGVVS